MEDGEEKIGDDSLKKSKSVMASRENSIEWRREMAAAMKKHQRLMAKENKNNQYQRQQWRAMTAGALRGCRHQSGVWLLITLAARARRGESVKIMAKAAIVAK
jgi:hypothetical protein